MKPSYSRFITSTLLGYIPRYQRVLWVTMSIPCPNDICIANSTVCYFQGNVIRLKHPVWFFSFQSVNNHRRHCCFLHALNAKPTLEKTVNRSKKPHSNLQNHNKTKWEEHKSREPRGRKTSRDENTTTSNKWGRKE